MHIHSEFNTFKSYLPIAVVMFVACLLTAQYNAVFSIGSHIVTGLWIILITAILTTIIQIIYIEKIFSKQLTQLSHQKERLGNEIKYRIWAEKTSSENKAKLQIVDENFPILLAYFSSEQRCHYHNRAFRQWFGLKPEQIENQLLYKFINQSFYAHIKHEVERALLGDTVQYQYIQQFANQSTCLIAISLIPHFDPAGKIAGFYILCAPEFAKRNEVPLITEETPENKTHTSINSVDRIIQAIEREEFCLFCQKILPVTENQVASAYYEILVRMAEEEASLIPPGAFLPLVNKYNLMPHLDRWVVKKAIGCLLKQDPSNGITFCLNLSSSTLKDLTFIDFVKNLLLKFKIQPNKLCFEIETFDVIADLKNTILFIRKIKQLGCLISLCSFNYNRASFDLLKHIKVDFLKIDGDIVCNILRDAKELQKIEKINKFAHTLKIETIGALVETQAVVEKLAEIGVNYAQGFIIGQPLSIEEYFPVRKISEKRR